MTEDVIRDWHVVFAFDVTAENSRRAAFNALDDMRDAIEGRMRGCTVDVTEVETGDVRLEYVDDVLVDSSR